MRIRVRITVLGTRCIDDQTVEADVKIVAKGLSAEETVTYDRASKSIARRPRPKTSRSTTLSSKTFVEDMKKVMAEMSEDAIDVGIAEAIEEKLRDEEL